MKDLEYLPKLIEELENISSWNSFASSLVMQYKRKNFLSEKQISSAQNMLNKMVENKIKREGMKKSFDTTKIEQLFQLSLIHI